MCAGLVGAGPVPRPSTAVTRYGPAVAEAASSDDVLGGATCSTACSGEVGIRRSTLRVARPTSSPVSTSVRTDARCSRGGDLLASCEVAPPHAAPLRRPVVLLRPAPAADPGSGSQAVRAVGRQGRARALGLFDD